MEEILKLGIFKISAHNESSMFVTRSETPISHSRVDVAPDPTKTKVLQKVAAAGLVRFVTFLLVVLISCT